MRIFSFVLLGSFFFFSGCNPAPDKIDWDQFIDDQLNFSIEQYRMMDEVLADSLTPRTFEDGEFKTAKTSWWCSGFYPGSLWYLYEYSRDESLREIAHRRTMVLEKEKNNIWTHDLGFMLYCSFGNGLRLTGNETYREILHTGAQSLASRFDNTVGCIRSWDHGDWEFPVIIDNMMNLEFLFWASRSTGNPEFKNISISHSDKTIENHFREDFSSYHLVDYDTITGKVILKETVQGYSDESAWSRGQAWGLYGFTSVYRESRNEEYLKTSVAIADYLLDHPDLPEDMIPYWDFNAPDIPDAKRDASAGAIMASALLELSTYVEKEKSDRYISAAKKMLHSLGTSYRAKKGQNGNFILKHSVGHFTANSEVDVPLTYADYYFIEGLLRLKKLNETAKVF